MSEDAEAFKKLIFNEKIIIVLIVFFADRATKMYLINLQASGTDIDFYIYCHF